MPSITVFMVPDGYTANDFDADAVMKGLRDHAFKGIDNDPTAEVSRGWVHYQDMVSFDFQEETGVFHGHYATFGIREDARLVSSRAFKRHFNEALKDWKEKKIKQLGVQGELPDTGAGDKPINPNPRPGKDVKKELKEQVFLKLRAKTLPEPISADVVWNGGTGIIYLFSTSKKVIGAFMSQFQATFGVMPLALDLDTIAKTKGFEKTDEKLGWDFLTWVWQNQQDPHKLEGISGKRDEIFVSMIKRVKLEKGEGDAKEGLVASAAFDLASMDGEIDQALVNGRKVVQGTVAFDDSGDKWTMGLKADGLSVLSGFKTPKVDPDEEDPHGVLMESLGLVETGVNYLVSLVGVFLKEKEAEGTLTRNADTTIRTALAAFVESCRNLGGATITGPDGESVTIAGGDAPVAAAAGG